MDNTKMNLGKKLKEIAGTVKWKYIAPLSLIPLGGKAIGKYFSGQEFSALQKGDIIELVAEILGIAAAGIAFSYAKEASITDSVTGLYNERYYKKNRKKILKKAQKDKQDTLCVLIDLKQFKSINDEYGFEKGSQVLNEFAFILSTSSRTKDYVMRIGGDEFLVLLLNADKTLGERFKKRIEKNTYKHIIDKQA
ncbi:GGDEF domain-containing protein, partial [Candidatus Woesearchaeota archaeon]|nr:GGDEF domain-containing protein [Candidatus Woesearchaeota archaeon]